MVFEELGAERFGEWALAQPNGSFAQSAEFAWHRSRDGAKTAFLGVVADAKIVVAGLVSWQMGGFSGADFYCGPVGEVADEKVMAVFTTGLKKWAAARKISHVTMNPTTIVRTLDAGGEVLSENLAVEESLKTVGWRRTGAVVTPHFVYVKNLAKFGSAEELFRSFSAGTKAMIRGAEKNFISFRKLGWKELGRLEKLMEESAERQGFRARGVYFQESLFDSFAESEEFAADFVVAEMDVRKLRKSYDGRIKELEKEIAGTEAAGARRELESQLAAAKGRREFLEGEKAERVDVASGVFIKSARETVYLFAGNSRKYLRFNAIYLMIWQEMKEAFENKAPVFNFYGVAGKFDGSDGILGYKRGFNGVVQEYAGQWILVVNPLKYNSVRVLKKLRG
jgi:alanine adding enzyme